jgi:hypothetical protein
VCLTIYIFTVIQFLLPADFQFIDSVKVEGDVHFSDPIGNVYIIRLNHLQKYGRDFSRAAEYTNLFLGNISSIDVSDPLRILIYYGDLNQIIWVDNYLSEIRSPVSLDDLGADQTRLVCSSNQGGFWILNGLNNQLQYYDVNLQLIHESMTLNSLTGPDIEPAFMLEKSRHVYLNIPEFGILVFDQFANHVRTIPLEIPGAFQVTDQNLYFFSEGELLRFNFHSNESGNVPLPEVKEILKVEMQPDFLYIFRPEGYSVYQVID